jgi:hypothetical protein
VHGIVVVALPERRADPAALPSTRSSQSIGHPASALTMLILASRRGCGFRTTSPDLARRSGPSSGPRIDGDGDIRDVIELLRLVYDQAAPRDGLPREV